MCEARDRKRDVLEVRAEAGAQKRISKANIFSFVSGLWMRRYLRLGLGAKHWVWRPAEQQQTVSNVFTMESKFCVQCTVRLDGPTLNRPCFWLFCHRDKNILLPLCCRCWLHKWERASIHATHFYASDSFMLGISWDPKYTVHTLAHARATHQCSVVQLFSI